MVSHEHDIVSKIILKNLMVNPNMPALIVNPNVVRQLEEHFRKKFEKEIQPEVSVDWDEKVWEPFKDDY
jgi:hypothetical protein